MMVFLYWVEVNDWKVVVGMLCWVMNFLLRDLLFLSIVVVGEGLKMGILVFLNVFLILLIRGCLGLGMMRLMFFFLVYFKMDLKVGGVF